MNLMNQVVFGTALLGFCAAIHLVLVAACVPVLRWIASFTDRRSLVLRILALLGAAFAVMVLAHTVQIWLWAITFLAQGAFSQLDMAFYFALVTYTTLGYGDIVLGEGVRVFGAFASITGLLTFGISTAFLLAVIVRVLPFLNFEH